MKAIAQKVESAQTYQFTFKNPKCLWANFTVNDSTGELNIQSDAGNWSHRWNIGSLHSADKESGKPLTHFLGVTAGPDYILDKLGYNHTSDLADVISKSETLAEVRGKILESRREEMITHDDARCTWKEADEWLNQYSLANEVSAENAVEAVYSGEYDHLKEFFDLIRYDAHELFVHEKSHIHNFLLNELLPFFQNHLRVEVLKLPPKGS